MNKSLLVGLLLTLTPRLAAIAADKFDFGGLEVLLKGGTDGKVVLAGDSQKSPLVIAVAQLDEETAMPPKRGPGRRGPGGAGGGGGFSGPGGPDGDRTPRGEGGGGPRSGPGGFGTPPKPLTAEQ